MLAEDETVGGSSGALEPGLYHPGTWLIALIGFIADQLPTWRDREDRRAVTAETALTSQLCGHLNGVARKTPGWDFLQFRIEEPDTRRAGRRIDLVPAPAGEVLWIDGRRYGDFDTLLPIECKRLPTPRGTARDKREYVRTSIGATGGIQRFKAGLHGADHDRAAVIGYVQSRTIEHWTARLDRWIRALARVGVEGWRVDDCLTLERRDLFEHTAVLRSVHARDGGLAPITVHHLWIEV